MKIIQGTLVVLHLIVALFAFLGGWVAISQPMAPFGISTDMLANSPFDTFLIPGLLLFGVIGIGQLVAAASILFHSRFDVYFTFITSGMLLIWLIVQVLMIRTVEVPHIMTFVIGCVQLSLSLTLIYKRRLFPADYILRFLRNHIYF